MLVSYKTETGEIVWKNESLKSDFNLFHQSLAMTDNHLFVPGTMSRVFRVEKNTGEHDLTFQAVGKIRPEGLSERINNIKISSDNFAYFSVVGNDANESGAVFCYDALTGEYVWEYNLPVIPSILSDSTGSNPGNIALLGERIFIKGGRKVTALNRATGSLLWEKSSHLSLAELFNNSGIAAQDNKVYASSRFGNIYCFDAVSGDLVWMTRSQELITINDLEIAKNLVFFQDYFGINGIGVLQSSTGNILWSDKSPGQGGLYGVLKTNDKYLVNLGTAGVFAFILP